MIRIVLLIAIVIWAAACKTGPGLFGKQSAHEKYASKIKSAGLAETALGRQWLAEAGKAIEQPVKISIPYKEMGYFPADKPRAVGLRFTAKRGQKIMFDLEKNPATNFLLFADLWQAEEKPSLLLSADSTQNNFEFVVDEDGDYLLRLQPELLKSGDYTISISIGPSLASPVAGNKGRVASVWGDARDAGVRQHEGIDLFAPFRTPVVAAADGIVTRVNENNLGGRVVWLRPKGRNLSLYYAHLDEQLVTAGKSVKAGDTLGLIGNTGNARTTPPHLHFGIYAVGGAINPLPFVDQVIKEPSSFSASRNDFEKYLKLTREEKLPAEENPVILQRNTIVEPVAITADQYRIVLPDGGVVFVSKKKTAVLNESLKNSRLEAAAHLYDKPALSAAKIIAVEKDTPVKVYGYFEEFAFVELNETKGWIPDSLLHK